MSIEITPLKTRKHLMEFIKLPWKIYRDNPYWVPPLIMDMKKILHRKKNPFFQHSETELFLAKQNGESVGRIAAILNNNHNKFHNEKTGFFGFFESINNLEVSRELLNTAQTWLKAKGMTTFRGPMNFSTNETCGLLIEGFDSSPVLMMPFNPEFYGDLMEEFGLNKIKELYAYYFDQDRPMPQRFEALAKKTHQDKTIRFRTLNLKDVWNEVDRMRNIYNEAWSENWGFVPMTDAEFNHMAKELKPIADPDIIYIAEINGEPAGFSLALPDYNQILKDVNGRLFPIGIFKLLWKKKNINRIRVITLGVKNKYQKKRGLAATFYYETYTRGKRKGYSLGEFSWILEDNVLMNRALEALGAKRYKRYAIYEKEI